MDANVTIAWSDGTEASRMLTDEDADRIAEWIEQVLGITLNVRA